MNHGSETDHPSRARSRWASLIGAQIAILLAAALLGCGSHGDDISRITPLPSRTLRPLFTATLTAAPAFQPTTTPSPTDAPAPPTATPAPTDAPLMPTETRPAVSTLTPTDTVPATGTSSLPTQTPAPPTTTPQPADTAVPPTGVPVAPTKPAPGGWDPRGMIAFERRGEGSEFYDIYLMYNDGSRVENLTNYPADDGAPTWSPNGNFIAFSSNRVGDNTSAIFKIDLRNRQVTQLTSGEFKDDWPTWSPDGSKIAFMRQITTNGHRNGEIFVMNADGTDQRNITNYEWGDDFPAWSRDGQWIAFTSERNWGGRDLWVMRPDGSDAHIVRRTDFQAELYPTWSPDGQIYHTYSPAEGAGHLYRIRPDGSDAAPLFGDNHKRWIASFSPDGQCFVYYSYLAEEDKEVWKWCQGYDISVNLTHNVEASDEYPAWSPVQ